MDVKAQEYKFVEWSRVATADTYDVDAILRHVNARNTGDLRVLDVGGGIGKVASILASSKENLFVDVIDSSPLARDGYLHHDRTSFIFGDYFRHQFSATYDFIVFRTALHHFIGKNEDENVSLQIAALRKAASLLNANGQVLVVENFYEPMLGQDTTGRLIFELTSLQWPAKLFRKLGANTAGEGVRFRSFGAWNSLFRTAGLQMQGDVVRESWTMPLWQRLPLVCAKRYQALVPLVRATA